MQAIVLAGGRGRRLAPYTTILPKPLMPVEDKPILEIVLLQLQKSGFKDVIIALGYLGHLIQAYFQDGEKYGLNIRYSWEEEPLGTAGPLGLVSDLLDDEFLVLNGDLLTTMSFDNLFQHHLENRADATIAVYERQYEIDFGVVEIDSNDILETYIEKPEYKFKVSMGINVLSRDVVEKYIQRGKYLDIPDLMIRLKEEGKLVRCYEEQGCMWLDIGRVDDYERAHNIYNDYKEELLRL